MQKYILCCLLLLRLVSSVLAYARRLAAKNDSEMTYFMLSGT